MPPASVVESKLTGMLSYIKHSLVGSRTVQADLAELEALGPSFSAASGTASRLAAEFVLPLASDWQNSLA